MKYGRFQLFKLKYREILVLGDSHAEVFESYRLSHDFKRSFNVVRVHGATISGLDNPNSKTKAGPIFEQASNKSSAKQVIVMLGEVDTGFVIWYRAEKYGKNVEEMFQVTVENYKQLLVSLKMKFDEVICMSTPLPTISDGAPIGEIANLRKSIKATQLQRTKLTIKLNSDIERFSLKNNITYINLDSQSVNSQGVVKSELMNKDVRDHHYDIDAYLQIIKNNLKL
ncbi:hypothetical protein A165_11050 [Vibrio tasmaniensis ZS-17]|nr:hypothetical protein A165_11050 [Vibrio tasmaniensis ZS-17]